MILAGDIGGTKTNLALFDQAVTQAPRFERHYLNRGQHSFIDMVRHFLWDSGAQPHAACFAVAGPIKDGRCAMPNLPWVIDVGAIREAIKIEQVALINDVEATAHGIFTLSPEQLMAINPGTPDSTGNKALIAAGTGLGEAILFRDGGHYRVSPSEGGHTDFAPRTEEELALLRFLWTQFGHVSCERLVSGPGLANIYDYLCFAGHPEEPRPVAERIAGAADRSAAIARAAIDGESPRCGRALEWFISVYGAEAGNLALKALATGGVYIGGGIAPKVAANMTDGQFMRAFRDKGRLSEMLSAVPVMLVLEPKTALRGAAAWAENNRLTA